MQRMRVVHSVDLQVQGRRTYVEIGLDRLAASMHEAVEARLTGALSSAQLGARFGTGESMNSIPAQDIKRRGISAVDGLLRDGPVHVIKNNRPSYVVLTEAAYAELLESYQDAARERLRASLADLEAGRTKRYESADALMQALDGES